MPFSSARALLLPFPKSKVSSAQMLNLSERNRAIYSSISPLIRGSTSGSDTFTVWCAILSRNENLSSARSGSSHIDAKVLVRSSLYRWPNVARDGTSSIPLS